MNAELKINHPAWLRIKFNRSSELNQTASLLAQLKLNTICDEGLCPNRVECFSHGVATFMILGKNCTRNCRYCNVSTGKPFPIDENEPERIAQAVKKLRLRYVVITSVNRDDLPDGGAAIFIQTIRKIREFQPNCKIELLIPDFKGDKIPLERITRENVDVLSHNLETVRELFPIVRAQGNYDHSLRVLREIKNINPQQKTKSGLILGLGEHPHQIARALFNLRQQNCDFLTLGQYLQPSEKHLPVAKYYSPELFKFWKNAALRLGFQHVESGPLIRSSYRADKLSPYLKSETMINSEEEHL